MLSIVILLPLARVATPAVVARFGRAARLAAWAVLLTCGLLAARPSRAEEAKAELDAALLDNVRHMAVESAGQNAGGGKAGAGPRVEVQIGQLDPRLRLAPCQSIEPYLPAGMRLWGKSRIGLRCKSGPTPWNVFLPVTVKVWGRGLIVPAGATVGTTLTDNDVAEAEVDLAEEFTPAVSDPKLAIGRVLTTNLRAGQALRQAHLKSRQWFAAGDTVKVIAQGDGFALESEGQALGNGLDGQPVRVRTESGRVLTGVPSGERRIEVTL